MAGFYRGGGAAVLVCLVIDVMEECTESGFAGGVMGYTLCYGVDDGYTLLGFCLFVGIGMGLGWAIIAGV